MGPAILGPANLTISGKGIPDLKIPLKVKLPRKDIIRFALDGNRQITATAHCAQQLRIGDFQISVHPNLEMWCANDNSLPVSVDVDGFLGVNVLQKTIFQVNPDLDAVRFLARLPADPGVAISLTDSPTVLFKPANLALPQIRVNAHFSGGHSESFMVDTGFPASILLRSELYDRLEAAGEIQSLESESAAAQSKASANRRGCIRSLRVGSFEHHNIICGEHRTENILGLVYLRRFISTFDLANKTIYLRPSRYYAKSEAEFLAYYATNILSIWYRVKRPAEKAQSQK